MNVKKAQYRIALISLFFVPLLLVLTTTAVAAASVSLRWDPNDPAPEGYRVFARISHKVYNYNQPDWEGNAVTCTIDNLEDQTEYCFVVRAYDGNLESTDSEEACYLPPDTANHSPVAINDTFNLAEGGTINVDANAGVLANDSDPDGDTLTVASAGGVSHGTLTLDASGAFTYAHNGSDRATDGFTYTLSDGNGNTDSAQVMILIRPVNDASPPSTDPDTDDAGIPESSINEDDDGMPDDWETQFGLNPIANDADGDPDQDGISNRDEYRAGLEPDDPGVGTAPQQPTALSPAPYALVACTPVIRLEDYSDADGDAHIATQWQLYDAMSGGCLLDVISDSRLTRLNIPVLLLNGETSYQWRVRFFDSGGRASAWSSFNYFVTDKATDDLDGNGIPDNQEVGDVRADVTRSISSPPGHCEPRQIVVISENTKSEIEQIALMDPADFEIDETMPVRLPSATLAYKLVLQQPVQQERITIHLSDPAPAGATWVDYDTTHGWQDNSAHAVFSEDRQSVTVEIKDGDYGDADGVINGIVINQAGLSTVADDSSTAISTKIDTGGDGGNCFVTSAFDSAEKRIHSAQGRWQWFKNRTDQMLADLINN